MDPAGNGPPDARSNRGESPAIAAPSSRADRALLGMKRCGAAVAKAVGRLTSKALGKLWRAAWAHPAPTFGASLAGLAIVILAMVPSADGYYTTGLKGGGGRQADLECLALNIYHEARGEPRYGKFAVGHVVINRAKDPRFPNDICAVVKQGGEAPLNNCQFSWWCDGRSDDPLDARAWLESKAAASLVYGGRVTDPTGGAMWYHADFVAPSWRSSLTEGHKIGRHIFYHPN